MSRGITHWQILARDRAGLSKFYTDMFGWKTTSEDEMDVTMVAPAEGGIVGEIIGATDKFSVQVVIVSDDADGDVAKITSAGGAMTEELRDVGGMVKIGRFTEPGGVEVGIFQDLSGEMPGGEIGQSDASPIVHFEIQSADGGKSQSFFSNVFGWNIDANNPMDYGMADTGGPGINGGVISAQGPQGTVVYAAVDNPQAALDKAESLGGKTMMPVTEIPDMVTFAIFTDPEGNPFGVVKNS